MKYIKGVFIFFLLLQLTFQTKAQRDINANTPSFHYRFETGFLAHENKLIPFWLRSNQSGAYPNEGTFGYIRQEAYSRLDSTSPKIGINYGLDAFMLVGDRPVFIMPEYKLELRLHKLTIGGGRYKGMMGLADTTLTSGSLTWSGNALGIPQLRIAIPEYTKLFFKWFYFKGHFSHGWFGDQVTTYGSFLHQKSLYGRLGKPKGVLQLYGGILHNVQWGGFPKYQPWGPGDDRFIDGKFPNDWNTYKEVVLPIYWKVNAEKYSYFELNNRFGNHVGQIDLGGSLNFKSYRLLLYKQTMVETGQTISSLSNTDDGLYGISYQAKNNSVFKGIVGEYLRTTNQGRYRSGIARLLGLQHRQYYEETYYFNHMQYQDGWAYKNHTIGTPFLVPQQEIRVENQEYPTAVFYNNNYIDAYYLAMRFKFPHVLVDSRFSYTKNYGSLFNRFERPISQFSSGMLMTIDLNTKGAYLKLNVGMDNGDLIYNTIGGNIAYMRIWN